MEKRACRLCFRTFANGRALGGHMRSHVTTTKKAAAAAAASPQPIKDSSSSFLSESSSSFRDVDDVEGAMAAMVMGPLGYGLRENPKKSFRLVDPEFSATFRAVDASSSAAAAAGTSVVVQDRESETESSRSPTIHRRRSKRSRRSSAAAPHPPVPEPEPISSVSDTTPEEDVAISLMILSRDIWTAPMTKSEDHQSEYNHQRFVLDYDDDEEEEDDEIDIGSASRDRINQQQPVVFKGRSKNQCGTCKKVFRSYQALGGHRASHKKTNGCVPPTTAAVKASTHTAQIHEVESGERNVESSRGAQHECPVCYRVFSSGQALGGHKRSHLTSSSAATITITSSSIAPSPPVAAAAAKYRESLIDLNLPAPMEDDAELSAVSDAEFVMVGGSKQARGP